MKINEASLREIKDSRGELTIEIGIKTKDGEFFAQIPSGKSRGSREATVFLPGKAREVLGSIGKELIGRDFESIEDFDFFLLGLDGTPNKSKLGGNLMLGFSLAFVLRLARGNDFELWRILKKEFFPNNGESKSPRIFSNFIEGGVHTDNNLDIQEFLVVAESKEGAAMTYRKLAEFYKSVGEALKGKYNFSSLKLGDEGGYSLYFKNNFEPIELLGEEIKRARLAGEFSLGLDAAASSFYKGGHYVFEAKELTSDGLKEVYSDYFRKAPFLNSIEDPFDENDSEGFAGLRRDWGDKLIIGDDLTVTNAKLIRENSQKKLINGVIIKPNQIGTVSETCEAINAAYDSGLQRIISHRSGETPDNFLVHFAKAAGAEGLKIGAPARERVAKFEEFVRLYS